MDSNYCYKRVTVYNYSKSLKEYQIMDYMPTPQSGGRRGRKAKEVSEEDRKEGLRRAYKNARRLCLSNGIGRVHLTLTYKNKQEYEGSIDKADKQFKKFIYNLRQLYPNLKYLATREIQEERREKTGEDVLHYHVLINHRIPKGKIDSLWNHGFTWIQKHPNQLQAVMYALKYIMKQLGKEEFITENGQNKKAYLSSRGLKATVEQKVNRCIVTNPDYFEELHNDLRQLLNNGQWQTGWSYKWSRKVNDEITIEGESIMVQLST